MASRFLGRLQSITVWLEKILVFYWALWVQSWALYLTFLRIALLGNEITCMFTLSACAYPMFCIFNSVQDMETSDHWLLEVFFLIHISKGLEKRACSSPLGLYTQQNALVRWRRGHVVWRLCIVRLIIFDTLSFHHLYYIVARPLLFIQ